MDMQRRNEAVGEAKHKARVNEMEGEKIVIQGYATELI
jgi:hypothetical protein